MPLDTQLRGLTVLITGASGGIGRALARQFAQEGAQLVLHAGTHLAELEEWVASEPDLRSSAGAVQCAAADVRDPVALQRLVDDAVARFGRVDVCVVNAGIWPADDLRLDQTPEETLRRVVDVNLLGALFTAQAFMRALARTGPRADHRGASLTFVGSTAGRFGEAQHAVYAATKAALLGLARSLKNELVTLDPYGRVNTVEPGWTVTPMAEAALREPGVVERVTATMPLRQLARAEDVAAAVLFLSSPALARHVSGEVLTVAGGMEGRQLWQPSQIDVEAVRQRLREP